MQNLDSDQFSSVGAILYRYKHFIALGLLSLVVLIVGMNYWWNKSALQLEKAAELYQEMLVADNKKDMNIMGTNQVVLQRDYPNTQYAAAASLLLAKHRIQNNELESAEKLLRPIVENKVSNELLGHVARVRLARVLRERGDFNGAIALLTEKKMKDDNHYAFLYQEALGDVYVAKGENDLAKTAYQQALAHLPPQGQNLSLLKMKLAELGSAELSVGETNAS